MVCFILCVCWAVIIILSEFQLMTEFSVQAPQYSYSESLWSWLGDIGRRCWNKCWSVKGPMSLSKAMALKFGLTSHLASVFKSWGHKSNCHRKGFYKSLMTLIIEFRFWTLAIGQERSLARSMSVCIWQNTCQMPNALPDDHRVCSLQLRSNPLVWDIRNSRLIRRHFGEFESCQDDRARSSRSLYTIDVSSENRHADRNLQNHHIHIWI
jgi:hypothetical protein